MTNPVFSQIEQQFLANAAFVFTVFVVSAVLAHLAVTRRK